MRWPTLLTSFHLVLERGRAVLDQLLQRQRRVRHVQIQQALHLLRMVELEHLLVAIVAGLDEVQQHVNHLLEKLASLRAGGNIVWQDIWTENG